MCLDPLCQLRALELGEARARTDLLERLLERASGIRDFIDEEELLDLGDAVEVVGDLPGAGS